MPGVAFLDFSALFTHRGALHSRSMNKVFVFAAIICALLLWAGVKFLPAIISYLNNPHVK